MLPNLVVLVAHADALYAGVRATGRPVEPAERLAAELMQEHADIGPFRSLDSVPWFSGATGNRPAEQYLASCTDEELADCELVCGMRGGAAYVLGATVLPGRPATVELRLTSVGSARTVRAVVPLTATGGDAAEALRRAMRASEAPPPPPPPPPDRVAERLSAEGAPDAPDAAVLAEAVAARDGIFVPDVDRLDEFELARVCGELGLTPNEVRAWRASGMELPEFRRRLAGRRGRFELLLSPALAAGSVVPAYAGELRIEPTGEVGSSAATYRLDTGLATELGVGLGVGVSRTVALRVGLGFQAGEAAIWTVTTADGAEGRALRDEAVGAGPRPLASLGGEWVGAPLAPWHVVAVAEGRLEAAPALDGVTGAFVPADGGLVVGARAAAGPSRELRGGVEARLLAGVGAWANPVLVDVGAVGPPSWPAPLPLYAHMSVEFVTSRSRFAKEAG